jgi:hypothetical protein
MDPSLRSQFERLCARVTAAGEDGPDDERPEPYSPVAAARARVEWQHYRHDYLAGRQFPTTNDYCHNWLFTHLQREGIPAALSSYAFNLAFRPPSTSLWTKSCWIS